MQDVVNVLAYEDLRDVVLVGHSFGGMVLPAVADRAADRLARRIYVDALLPRAGECAYDLAPPEVRAEEEEAARLHGEGWRIPPSPGADWRATPFPIKPCQQPLHLTGAGDDTVPGVYIHCTAKTGWDFCAPMADRARARGWPVYELATGHSPLRSEADRTALVDLLLTLV